MSPESLDPQKLLEQAQELSGRMQRLQDQLRLRTVDATVGGGMVRCQVNGQLEVTQLEIAANVVQAGDVAMLQDLIVAAVNQGLKQARELAQAEMSKATGLPMDLLTRMGG